MSNDNRGVQVKYTVMAAIFVAALASSCTRKAEGQTVAIVNGQEITVPDLNFALELAKVPEGADKTKARAQVLQQLVDRRLLAEQARKEGIDKTPDYLNRERRADEDLLISMLADRRLKTTQLPSDREVQNFMATHPEMFAGREIWTLNQVVFQAPTDPAVKNAVQGAHSIDALMAVLQQYKIAYRQQSNRLDTATIPPDLFGKLKAVPSGEPFAVTAGKQMVASVVTAKESKTLSGDEAKPLATQAMRKMQTTKNLESQLKSLRSSAKIEYQSGYGPPKKS